MLEENPIKELLKENYILWYQSFEPNPLELPLSLPFISIINPDNPNVVFVDASGVPDREALASMIEQHSPVSIGKMQDVEVFTNGNMLYVKTDQPLSATVYSITGAVANQLSISEVNYRISLSKGIYIVKLSNGLVRKVVIR